MRTLILLALAAATAYAATLTYTFRPPADAALVVLVCTQPRSATVEACATDATSEFHDCRSLPFAPGTAGVSVCTAALAAWRAAKGY